MLDGTTAKGLPRKSKMIVRLKFLQTPEKLRCGNQGEGEFPLSDKQESADKLNVLNSTPASKERNNHLTRSLNEKSIIPTLISTNESAQAIIEKRLVFLLYFPFNLAYGISNFKKSTFLLEVKNIEKKRLQSL